MTLKYFLTAAIICPAITVPTNGNDPGCSTAWGTVCSFTCEDGYDLTGSASLTCGDGTGTTGSWGGSEPTCVGK